MYNLRRSSVYLRNRRQFDKTRPKASSIGDQRKPQSDGKPGYIRVDTVHQGDMDGVKGLYHINAVDEETQFDIVCAVEKISERYLIPVLEQLLEQFPFVILSFHADNGSEYINRHVVKLLNKLMIDQAFFARLNVTVRRKIPSRSDRELMSILAPDLAHFDGDGRLGNVMMNRVNPSVETTSILPAWALTIDLTMASPSPTPSSPCCRDVSMR